MPSSDACPVAEFWGCTGQFDSAADVPGSDVSDESDEPDGDNADEDDGSITLELEVGSDEILIGRSITDADDVWAYEIFTQTKWVFSDVAAATNNRAVAVTYDGERTWEGAPRVIQPNEARLQILDPRGRDVVIDTEFPRRISSLEWTSDDRLIVTDADGRISVFEADSSEVEAAAS